MLAIRAARLFDGSSPTVSERALVLIESGRITAVEHGAVEPPAGAEIIDLGDVTLLPGLIDVHVHLGFDATEHAVDTMNADSDGQLLLRMAHAAREALHHGVTTVRDLGDRDYLGVTLRDWYRTGTEVGPEIIAAGPPITLTGGHCWFMHGEVDGVLGVRKGVREHVKRGADVIKIMATGGNMTPGTNPMEAQFTVEELAAAVEESHRLGRQITAHAHGAPGIARAVEAGVDSIEHCSFQTPTGIKGDDALIEQIAAKGIYAAPTIGRPRSDDLPPEWVARQAASLELVGHMHRMGVKLVTGTDAGIRGVPHYSALYSVINFSRAGLSNAAALATATSVAAESCGIAERKGRLATGMDADLLAVSGNPLDQITDITNVAAVFRAGMRVR